MTDYPTIFYEERIAPADWYRWIGKLWAPWELVAEVGREKIKRYSYDALVDGIIFCLRTGDSIVESPLPSGWLKENTFYEFGSAYVYSRPIRKGKKRDVLSGLEKLGVRVVEE